MSGMRIFGPLLAMFLIPGAALAAPGDPYVVYTANNYADGGVILRTDPAAGSLVEISRNGPQGTLFERPFDLALEADGDIVVADMGTPCTTSLPRCADDGRIIRVDSISGRQTLVASGTPLVDPAGIAVAPDGSIYVADNFEADDDGAVIRVDPGTGAKTLLTEGGLLDLPFGILVDQDGSLVVSNRMSAAGGCDGTPGRLVRVQLAGGSPQLIAEAGSWLFNYPLGVALDSQGRIAFANECGPNGLVRLGSIAGSPITGNIAGDVLVTPERLALDPAGDFLVSDFSVADGDGGIVKVDAETGAQSLVRQGDLFNHPMGIAAVVNRPPVAVLRLPVVAAAGRAVRMDGSASTDPERLRLVYEWDLDGDGVFETGSGTDAVITPSWALDGPVTVRMRVNDPHGGRAVVERMLEIDGSVPVLTGLEASSNVIAIGGRASADKDGPPPATRVRFRVSESAEVRVAVHLARRGRRARKGGSCKPRARHGRRCTRLSRARVFTRAARAGTNSVLIKAEGLRPGAYRVGFTATDAVGNEATERSLALRVVR